MKKIIAAVLCILAVMQTVCVNAEYKEDDLKNTVNAAIEWKQANDNPQYSIGTESSDLYIMALGRMGKGYDYASYLSGLNDTASSYTSSSYSTDMTRTVLATLASGGDPGYVGWRDLLADSTYASISNIGNEGAKGYAWALLALDSKWYDAPEWAVINRNTLLSSLLSRQNTDGSFDGDAYATASAITALAPYYENTGAYTVTQNETGYVYDVSPRDAVDKAVEYLADVQTKYGDFGSLKATAMTIIALDTMGINPDGDSRFEAKKGNAIDGLMLYKKSDGGFSSDLKGSDGEGTSYALCAMTSHLRSLQGKASFFRFDSGDMISLSTASNNTSNAATAKTNTQSSTAKATAAPKVTATARPKVTIAPSETNPTDTMQPTKTTTPQSEAEEGEEAATPIPTKKPALVGPVEAPGPMPQTDSADVNNSAEAPHKNSAAGIVFAIVILILLLAAAVCVALSYLARRGKLLPQKIADKINIISTLVINKAKEWIEFIKEFIKAVAEKYIPFFKKKDKTYKAKSHRKTDVRRRFDNHEKFRLRRKFNRRRKFK